MKTDVLIIGAGCVGVAIARELAKYELSVLVVDKNDDVGGGASRACSGCTATPATMTPGTLEARMRQISQPMIYQLCRELDVPVRQCGSLTVAVSDAQMEALPAWLDRAYQNGVYDAEELSREALLEMEPALSPEVRGGVYIARDGHVNQFLLVVAQAENAAENGAHFLLNCEVTGMDRAGDRIERIHTTRGDIEAAWVINAAGLFCDEIARMAGECDFRVHPRKGEFYVLARENQPEISHIIRTVSGGGGHGTLVIPTVDDNILAGPDAEDITDRNDYSTTAEGLALVKKQALMLVPGLNFSHPVTQFAGLRAVREPEGFFIEVSRRTKGYVGISGIRSTGLTSSLGIAKYAVLEMQKAGLDTPRKKHFVRERRGIVRFADQTDAEKDALIRQDPLYGRIVCRCEQITESEIRQAIRRPVGAGSIDAVKRRVRAGMGRCQGGFCSPLVCEILADELGIPMSEVTKRGGARFCRE